MTANVRYRIIEHWPVDGEHLQAVHEVRYDEEGRLTGFVGIPVEVVWPVHEGNEAGLRMLDLMREAFTLPVLKASDFPKEPPQKKKPA